MNKESASKFAQVIRDAQSALISVTQERDKLAAENSAFRRRAEATKVAAAIHDKGIDLDVDFPDLVERLEKAASDGRLGEIERAVDMVGPDMSFGKTNHDDVSHGGSNSFEGFIMGTVG